MLRDLRDGRSNVSKSSVPLSGLLEVFGGDVDDGDARRAEEQADEAAEVGEEVDDVIDDHLLDDVDRGTREQKFHLKMVFSGKLNVPLVSSFSKYSAWQS